MKPALIHVKLPLVQPMAYIRRGVTQKLNIELLKVLDSRPEIPFVLHTAVLETQMKKSARL